MSKRRINNQQSQRIKKNQMRYQEQKELQSESLSDGLVISRFGRHVEIEAEQGHRIRCAIRPNLETLVAGDRIIWQLEGNENGVVVSLYPRASMLARPTARGLEKPVAANITQMIIVIAPKPEVTWPLLDSYLIMAETLRLHAVILLNKTDLDCEEIKNTLESTYRPLNYPILYSGITLESQNSELANTMNHQVSVFVGQSGVGKSSLIAKLLPHETNIVSNSISEHSELGKHTTSNSRFYHIPTGGALIDSPGVREFSLWKIEADLIAKGYRELQPLISQCKFRNCTHIMTPYCAVIKAVSEGQVSKLRYENFIKLCNQYQQSR